MSENWNPIDYSRGKTLEQLKAEIKETLAQMQKAIRPQNSGLSKFT